MTHLTPKALDAAKWDEAYNRAQEKYPGGDKVRRKAFASDIYRDLTIAGWVPPPPVSPKVLAMREWYNNFRGGFSPANLARLEQGEFDEYSDAEAFLAGYDAAMRKAGILQDTIISEYYTLRPEATYNPLYWVADIGDETP